MAQSINTALKQEAAEGPNNRIGKKVLRKRCCYHSVSRCAREPIELIG